MLVGVSGVAQAVMVVRSDARTGGRLVGYVVPGSGVVDFGGRCGRRLRRLPSYMVPGWCWWSRAGCR